MTVKLMAFTSQCSSSNKREKGGNMTVQVSSYSQHLPLLVIAQG